MRLFCSEKLGENEVRKSPTVDLVISTDFVFSVTIRKLTPIGEYADATFRRNVAYLQNRGVNLSPKGWSAITGLSLLTEGNRTPIPNHSIPNQSNGNASTVVVLR
ncbi:MAG: hypothetical protein LBC20_13295 [Planctomycetaceae bacterium]|nr:hypothetical protein [Planctomycetaceae bacterium]